MDMHILVLSLTGALFVGALLLLWRLLRYRTKVRRRDAVVDKAVAQLRQTGIFFALGLNPDPEYIAKLQTKLRDEWGYEGEIDGHPNSEMLEAIDRMAEARGVNVDAEVLAKLPVSRSAAVLPEELRQELVIPQAQEHLARARPAFHRGRRVA